MRVEKHKPGKEGETLKALKAKAYLESWIAGSERQQGSSESVLNADISELEERFNKDELKGKPLSNEALAEVMKELKRGYQDGVVEVLRGRTLELLDY